MSGGAAMNHDAAAAPSPAPAADAVDHAALGHVPPAQAPAPSEKVDGDPDDHGVMAKAAAPAAGSGCCANMASHGSTGNTAAKAAGCCASMSHESTASAGAGGCCAGMNHSAKAEGGASGCCSGMKTMAAGGGCCAGMHGTATEETAAAGVVTD